MEIWEKEKAKRDEILDEMTRLAERARKAWDENQESIYWLGVAHGMEAMERAVSRMLLK